MATNTTRLGLRKPATTDLISAPLDIDDNMDKLDAAVDRICTSASRPSTAYVGMTCYETDTNARITCVSTGPNVWRYNGVVTVLTTTARDALTPVYTGMLVMVTADIAIYRWTGSAWALYLNSLTANIGRPRMGFNYRGSNGLTTSGATESAIFDSVTIGGCIAGRPYHLYWTGSFVASTLDDNYCAVMRWKAGGSVANTDTVAGGRRFAQNRAGAWVPITFFGEFYAAVSGTHTVGLSLFRQSGAGTCQVTGDGLNPAMFAINEASQ